ncbi:Ger(x)C family spore germination protein [Paenibacillus cremeus]|uniref:Ger(X)C family spore germination protein n=1 Tax=Paenibacillus cremeus TaxID=2163881 RepID=A0A559K869_9BACL|nr:Ger(x)C family spore germination protein [Paenibacillus cremeus]TVY08317.1 Ger(x)C family spore germination protein [Paenibacillus cremeus]
MNAIKRSLLPIALLILLSGCQTLEINNIFVVFGMALDKGENMKWKLSVQMINPTEMGKKTGGSTIPAIVYSQEGNSVEEIRRKMNAGLPRKLIYSHVRLFALNEEVAREGNLDFLDFLERDWELRDDFNMVIVTRGTALEVISTIIPGGISPSTKLFRQSGNFNREWGGDPQVKMKDMIEALTSEGRDPVVETVTVQGNANVGSKDENLKSGIIRNNVILSGLGVFNKQKLVGHLNLDDTRNYLWTQNLIKDTVLTVPCKDNGHLDVNVYDSGTKIKAFYDAGTPNIIVNIFINGVIDGMSCKADLSKPQTFLELEQLAEQKLKASIENTMKKVQVEYGSDIFGFGEDMYRQDTAAFKKVRKNWNEEFKHAELKAKVSIHLRRTGLRLKSYTDEFK